MNVIERHIYCHVENENKCQYYLELKRLFKRFNKIDVVNQR